MRFSERRQPCPMASSQNTIVQPDLNEVLTSIDDTMRKTYKNKEGTVYCAIGVSLLRKWHGQVSAAIQVGPDKELETALTSAKDTVAELIIAAENKDKTIKELQASVDEAKKRTEKVQSDLAITIKGLQAERTSANLRLKEALEAKAATSKALVDAEQQLKSSAAKYDPGVALELSKEVSGLKDDLSCAHSAIATCKAQIAELNKTIDLKSKESAQQGRELEVAKTNLSNFSKQLSAAKHGNWELFEQDSLKLEDLRVTLGPVAFAKLQEVMATPAWDVRGRIQRLQGYFTVFAKGINRKWRAMIGILKHALELLKESSATWSAVLAPWTNLLIKDLVTFNLMSVEYYRTDLQQRLNTAKSLGSSATMIDKARAHNEPERRTWAEIARARANTTQSLVQKMKARANERWMRLKAIAARAANVMRKASAIAWGTIKRATSTVRGAALRVSALFATTSGNVSGKQSPSYKGKEKAPITDILFDADPLN